MRLGAGEARVARVTIAVGAVFGVRCIQAAMAPLQRRSRPPHPSSKNAVVRDQYLSRAYLNVRLSDAHIPAYGRLISMVCNDILRDIPERDPPRTYVRTHVCTYVLHENRSSIQSLVLMRSAITANIFCGFGFVWLNIIK